jgi:hypothetical protein
MTSSVPPLAVPAEPVEPEAESEEIPVERVTVQVGSLPPGVIGHLVQKAIELWLFPSNPHLIPLLEMAARNEGLVQISLRGVAVQPGAFESPGSSPTS